MTSRTPPATNRPRQPRLQQDRAFLLTEAERLLGELIGRFVALAELETHDTTRLLWQQATPLLRRARHLVRAQARGKASR